MSTSCVIETQELSKTYKKIPAPRSLDLKVQQNSIFGFLGPNGAGKTTTIKLMLGLIRPTAGGATVFGMDCIRQSVDIRARVGYLPQEPHFYEYMTARQTLRFVASCFFKGPKKGIEKRIDEMLEMVNLTGKADRPIRTFSGGERQRLGIAQAQINYPDLLIVDEPAANTAFMFFPNLDWTVYNLTEGVAALVMILTDRTWKKLPSDNPAVYQEPPSDV